MREESADFLQLMRYMWTLKVTKYARVALLMKQKLKLMPDPKDLQKITEDLMGRMKSWDLTKKDPVTFHGVAIDTEASLLLHNKKKARRS